MILSVTTRAYRMESGVMSDSADPPPQRKLGTFLPGKSGNPSGRPKGVAALASDIRRESGYGNELKEFLFKLFRSGTPDDQKWAFDRIMDRGWGKAAQVIDLHAEVGPSLRQRDTESLSIDEHRAYRDHLRAAALIIARPALGDGEGDGDGDETVHDADTTTDPGETP